MKSQGRDNSSGVSDGDEDSETSCTDSASSDTAGSDDFDTDWGPEGRSLNYEQSKTSKETLTSKTVTSSNTATNHYFLSDATVYRYISLNYLTGRYSGVIR